MVRRHTLLVVDDEPDVVQSLRDLLRREYHVLGATHPRDGLRLLHEQPVQIVMSDQRMPEINGVEFLRRVRGACPEAIRLLFTGYADIKAVIDAINEGHVYRYITKPWDPDELLTVLHQAGEQYELLQERQRLLDDLRNKNQELEKANVELRQANELKTAFINVASHELRTPLTILLSLPDLALRMRNLDAQTADWFRRIQQAGTRLHRLVEQLLQMLRAGCFERPLERRLIDCAALVRNAVEDNRPFVEQRRQQLIVDLAPDLGTINVEAEKIRVCLDNLLSNAIKFTPDQGTIEVRGRRLPPSPPTPLPPAGGEGGKTLPSLSAGGRGVGGEGGKTLPSLSAGGRGVGGEGGKTLPSLSAGGRGVGGEGGKTLPSLSAGGRGVGGEGGKTLPSLSAGGRGVGGEGGKTLPSLSAGGRGVGGEGGVCLQVRDNGIGIRPADLPHLFEPFFTEVDVSRHSSGQFEFCRRGLGLGLSLARALVRTHGGTLQVDSIPGQGTTFTLTLPAQQAADGPAKEMP